MTAFVGLRIGKEFLNCYDDLFDVSCIWLCEYEEEQRKGLDRVAMRHSKSSKLGSKSQQDLRRELM